MANHELKDIAVAALAELATALSAGYAGLSLTKGLFRPGWLPAFQTYAIVLSPQPVPWTERTIGVRYFQRIYRFDLFLLCKVTDEDLHLWGEASDPTKGIFQLVQDVKDTLRGNALGVLLDRTYEEVNGDVAFDQAAAPGFESGEKVLVYRAKVPYVVRTRPFCWPLIVP